MKTPLQELMEYMERSQYFIGNDLLAKYNELIEKEKQANKRLDEIDFFDLMQNYRIADMADQENVVNRFEAVKEWIRQK